MLIVNRKIDQRLVIAGNIEVCICDIKGNTVKIGVEAPEDVDVHREEVWLRIQEQREGAA